MTTFITNPQAVRDTYDAALRQIMSIERAEESRRWLAHWPMLAAGPTPLWSLPDLAARLGIAQLALKDESKRASAGSFKVLGAPIALVRLIIRQFAAQGWSAADLFAGRHAEALGSFTVVSATDGNHGRALAAAAQSIGCRCVIVIHRHVSDERAASIAAFGARVIRIDGNYDASVVEAARLAEEHGWHVVSDTSWDGYEEIPRDVMQGYGTIAAEAIEQAGGASHVTDCPFTHVLLQGGVGGLAAGIVSYFAEMWGAQRPTFIVVEPQQADCLLQSALAQRAALATGSVDSVMAGLACGATSPLAWRFLAPSVDGFMTVDDDEAIAAMRLIAAGGPRDVPIVGGESGVAGLAGLIALVNHAEWRERAALDAASRVLLINTEGATAPALYRELVGRSADDVLAAQARHPGSR
ncbi:MULTISPECIES: diaminopropionate ammonia-lyase [Paraburkholderia]|uniref:diaminopropionate ammonia-lyase n=1 Tax=Paraburkholderia TaxID=1822464 RepID=UPI002254E110|nr:MULTISPECIES: diaminopropionate ammonia-lyase [Paraburkholderia]MCX4164217.1 diaminopropionate ammonia-lyase [Paraburkholderia megapolitana]MDN7159711.1 diaminopropionate ammonia-lyase [Paraburkholderia sp. CHISQ3]MDQ6496758.1 diaminopropionate ammonia-lyase [Paraburkholderia megapolitana]